MSHVPAKPEAQVNKERQGEAGKLIVFDVRTLRQFKGEGSTVQVLSDSGAARMVLFVFKAGQQLPEHVTSSQVLVQTLRGHITFTAAGSTVETQAGMVLQVEANVPHRVVAKSDAVMLVTMPPTPAYHSLEREVFQHLTPWPRARRVTENKECSMKTREEAGNVGKTPVAVHPSMTVHRHPTLYRILALVFLCITIMLIFMSVSPVRPGSTRAALFMLSLFSLMLSLSYFHLGKQEKRGY